MENDEKVDVPNEDAELDSLISGTIEKIRQDNNGAAVPPETTKDDPAKPASVGESEPSSSVETPTAEVVAPSGESQTKDPEPYVFRPPIRQPQESQELFDIRVKMSELVRQKKEAITPTEQQVLSEQIRQLREDMRHIPSANSNRSQSFNNNGGTPPDDVPVDPSTDPNQRPLTEAELNALLDKREYDRSVRETLDSYTTATPELQDPDVRDVFFSFIDNNYQWQGKTGKELRTILDLAKQAMFRPDETVQESVLKGAKVQASVNAMQFPGGHIARQGLTPGQQKDVDDMVAAGVSESKARALILED